MMKKLIAELIENNETKKLEMKQLETDAAEEFIEALVLLCNKLDVDIPFWTHREEKLLQKKNEVIIPVNEAKNVVMRLYIAD